MNKRTTRLRRLLADPKILVAPGAYDGTGARLVSALGFQALYMSGFETSASVLGQPDVGYLTATQMADRVAALADIVDLPLIADGDTGYGNPLNVRRMVREYERAGAAALHIEDQTFPKRCGHLPGRDVVPLDDMVQKIKAEVDARRDSDFVLIARTDARTTKGLDEALRRGAAYHEAGADVLFIESPENEDEMRRICAVFRGVVPVLSNQIRGRPHTNTGRARSRGNGLCACRFFTWNCFRRRPRYEELSRGPGCRRYKQGMRRSGDVRRLQPCDRA
jgi:2,3-dimethylmalate lyase